MKKGGFLRTVFDGLRSNQAGTQSGQGYSGSGSNQNKGLIDQYEGLLKSNHFALSTVVRHGFPAQPTAIAFDPVQRIVAIGTKSGSLRIFGRPSVDVHGQHKPEYAVLYIKFVVNQGAVITVTADDSIHLWSLRGPNLVLQLSTTSTNTSPLPPLSGVVGTSSSSSNASGSNHQSTTTSASAHHHQATMGANCVGGGGNSQSSGGGGGLEGGTFQSNSAKLNQTSKLPEILHTLKFQREHITYVHLTLQSKWLYIGTERGNVHIMNVETFELSGYVINWNKAIELSRKTHPGSIKHISECPQDTNKLLIGYESGYIVLWDLKTRAAEGRYYNLDNLQWLCWHFEGKQFTAAHGDGSLITWNTRSNAHPAHKSHPHAKTGGSSSSTGQQQQGDDQQAAMPPFRAINTELYRPINKVDWKTSRNNEQIVLFSGGLPYDNMPPTTTNTTLSSAAPSPQPQAHSPYNQQQLAPSLGPAGTSLSPSSPSPSPTPIDMRSPARNSSALASHQQQQQQQASASNSSSSSSSSHDKNLNSTSLTVMYGRSLTVLEMDDTIVDFITICDNSPYENDASEPFAVIILLVNDLILIDLNSPGYPSFQSPNPININASPVTSIHYLADCPSDLIPSLYSTSNNSVMTGQQRNRKGFSDKEWPIDGGEWGQSMQSYPELVITGHADGSVQFWDMSCVNFDPISKIKTSKLFDKPNRLQNNPNLIISGGGCGLNGSAIATSRYSPSPFGSSKSPVPPSSNLQSSQQQQQQIDSSTSSPPGNNDSASINQLTSQQQQQQQINNNEDYYAIEQIEFCPSTKHLLVAGACSQVIQFKLNRKEVQSELTTVIVEPTSSMSFNSSYEPMTGFGVSSLLPNQHANSNHKQHFILRPKSGHHRRTTGFQPELLCVTPWIISTANCGPEAQTMTYCQSPYRITSLALHTTHNLLAYSHDNGIVIIDVIQKCVVINSSTSELYGPMGMSHFGGGNRDIISSGVKCGAGNAGQMMGKSPKRMSGTAPANMAESNNPGQDNHSQADLFGQQQSRKSPSLDQHQQFPFPFASNVPIATATTTAITTTTTTASNQRLSVSDYCIVNSSQLLDTTTTVLASPADHTIKSMPPSSLTFRQQHQQQTAATSNAGVTGQTPIATAMAAKNVAAAVSPSGATAASQLNSFLHNLTSASSATAASSSINSNIINTANFSSTSILSGSQEVLSMQVTTANTNTSNQQQQQQQQQQHQQQHSPSQHQYDKIDASFTRSRSSSCSSTTDQVQNNSIESIQCIHFVDNHLGKSEATQLWMGTSHGAVLLIAITMPDSDDNRVLQLQSVIAVPTITNIKLSGSILCLYQLQMDLHNSNSNLGGHNGGHLHHLPSSSSTEEASTSGQINAATTTGVGASTTTAGAATTSGSGSSSLLNKQDSSSFDLPTTGGSGGSGVSGGSGGSGSGHHHHLGSSSSSNSGASSGGVVHHYHKAEQQQQQQQQRPSIMVIVSEKHARVYQLPLSASLLIDTNSGHCVTNQSTATTTTNRCLAAEQQQLDKDKQHNCLAKIKLTETSFACKSSIVSMKQPDESCLVTYLATGNILIHSLPKLKLLLDVDFVPLCNVRIATTLCFSRNGHGLYLSSASELTKFTINAAYKAMVNDMIGSVYVPKDMPEMPRPNFFKALSSSLFSTSGKSSDRDELFSETSAGKASRGVARHIPVAGSSGMDKLNRAAVGTVGHELRMAREGLDERGEKLSELEDKTLQMMNQAESYGQSASQLVAKFKDKKWYQF